MSLRKIEAHCPGCQAAVNFDVVVPDPQVQLIEDTEQMNAITSERDEFKRQAENANRELQRWQTGESHLLAGDMLSLLQSCPNCRPALDSFVTEVHNKAVSGLTVDQVKGIAKAQKWWPPPPIDLGPWPGRGG